MDIDIPESFRWSVCLDFGDGVDEQKTCNEEIEEDFLNLMLFQWVFRKKCDRDLGEA